MAKNLSDLDKEEINNFKVAVIAQLVEVVKEFEILGFSEIKLYKAFEEAVDTEYEKGKKVPKGLEAY